MYSYIWNTGDPKIQESLDKNLTLHNVSHIAPILWREHCMECAMPLCYTTCPIYKKRMDGRCLRFEHGITPIVFNNSTIKGARIKFRRWAKLQAFLPQNIDVLCLQKYQRLANRHQSIELMIRKLCNFARNYRLAQITASLLERMLIGQKQRKLTKPNGFLAIIRNEEQTKKELMLEILQNEISIYKTKFDLLPGWNQQFIPIWQMTLPSGTPKENIIRAYLSSDEEAILSFAYFDFVGIESNNNNAKPASKIKCVAWDLDNTLWKGIIGDDGAENVKINHEALCLIQELDARGILQTIVSKNTYDVAWNKITELKLNNMFLYPAINWEQKSKNIQKIADALNINVDSFALIDDSIFEREEVSTSLPQVRVYDAVEIPTILDRQEFNVPISIESKNRRQSYLNEVQRKLFSSNWGGTDGGYIDFLRACELEMSIFKPTKDTDIERCHELILRSNQYNISGNRYDKKEFEQLLSSPTNQCLAFKVKDRFGDYGIVGFASFETSHQDLILKDFVMSCRVAMKHIERAFIHSIFYSPAFKDYLVLRVNAIKTERNNPLREQLLAMPFSMEHEDDIHLNIYLNKEVSFEDENIIHIRYDN